MSALRRLFVFRHLCLALAALASALSFGAATANAQADPRWGMLAEMAEHDYIYGTFIAEAAVAARWEIPNRRLKFSQWSGVGNQAMIFELDAETGQLTGQIFGPKSQIFKLTAASDGSITVKANHGEEPLLGRGTNGSFRFRFPGIRTYDFRPLPKTHPKYARLAKAIAEGKERAADPNRLNAVALAQVQPQAAQVATPAMVQAISPVVALNTGPRLALVIGNSAYGASMGALPNPANDAAAMAATLKALGFTVHLVKDADQKTMKRAIVRLGQRLVAAGPGATGLFFYAGHGLQHRGTNYLVPIGAEVSTQADIDIEAVAADTVLQQMEEAGASTNIVILDACRNMPIVRGFRSPSRGLAPMDAPNGSFIAYSTAPGSVAADGNGTNSPFVTALIKNLGRKGESIESIFRDVRREVLTTTEGTQVPWDSSSLIQPFYFAGR